MSKAISYYDWSQAFKKAGDEEKTLLLNIHKKKLNSIGIAEDEFKEYIKKWKTKHLE